QDRDDGRGAPTTLGLAAEAGIDLADTARCLGRGTTDGRIAQDIALANDHDVAPRSRTLVHTAGARVRTLFPAAREKGKLFKIFLRAQRGQTLSGMPLRDHMVRREIGSGMNPSGTSKRAARRNIESM